MTGLILVLNTVATYSSLLHSNLGTHVFWWTRSILHHLTRLKIILDFTLILSSYGVDVIHNSLIGRCMRIFDGAIKNESLHHFLRTLHGFATLSLDLRTSLEMDGTLKVQLFWKGNKNLKLSSTCFDKSADLLSKRQNKRKIVSNFVAFSQCHNFNPISFYEITI